MSASAIHQTKKLDLGEYPSGQITKAWLHLVNNGIGEPIRIPVMVARGAKDGPTLGLTAALHGNELNGIPLIQEVFADLDVATLRGTVVGVLSTNVPGVLREQREFSDGVDLNRIAPGKEGGNRSQTYINRLIERVITKFDYLIDLHTASFGRRNSYYIRANMEDEKTARIARLHNPEIILNNDPKDSTVRGYAEELGITSVTLELRDSQIIQDRVVEDGINGVKNVLYDLDMQEGVIDSYREETVLCDSSYWIYSDEGGILDVHPTVASWISKGQEIAEVRNIFGELSRIYTAPEDGIVIGKSINPINQTGSRILHLGLNARKVPCLVD